MRLHAFTARDVQQAMAALRTRLGDDAMIVATRRLADGTVQVTGATERDDEDLAELLAPTRLPPGLARLLDMLAYHGLPDDLQGRLQSTLREQHVEQLGDDPCALLGQALAQLFRFAPLAAAPSGRLLLAGLPGSGKTASLAKLGARAVLEGRSVAILTGDAQRAGACEQLQALLAPIGLQPQIAATAADLRRLLAAATAELVLIDSPGLNPFLPADLGLLSALLDASAAEPLLVLPAGLAAADCAEIGHTFAALGARRMLVTKLDAARRLGGVLAAAAAGLALTEAGIGPIIGDGLHRLQPAGLARLLLHRYRPPGAGGDTPGDDPSPGQDGPGNGQGKR